MNASGARRSPRTGTRSTTSPLRVTSFWRQGVVDRVERHARGVRRRSRRRARCPPTPRRGRPALLAPFARTCLVGSGRPALTAQPREVELAERVRAVADVTNDRIQQPSAPTSGDGLPRRQQPARRHQPLLHGEAHQQSGRAVGSRPLRRPDRGPLRCAATQAGSDDRTDVDACVHRDTGDQVSAVSLRDRHVDGVSGEARHPGGEQRRDAVEGCPGPGLPEGLPPQSLFDGPAGADDDGVPTCRGPAARGDLGPDVSAGHSRRPQVTSVRQPRVVLGQTSADGRPVRAGHAVARW